MKTIKITKEYKPPAFKRKPDTIEGWRPRCISCRKGHKCKYHQTNGEIRH